MGFGAASSASFLLSSSASSSIPDTGSSDSSSVDFYIGRKKRIDRQTFRVELHRYFNLGGASHCGWQ